MSGYRDYWIRARRIIIPGIERDLIGIELLRRFGCYPTFAQAKHNDFFCEIAPEIYDIKMFVLPSLLSRLPINMFASELIVNSRKTWIYGYRIFGYIYKDIEFRRTFPSFTVRLPNTKSIRLTNVCLNQLNIPNLQNISQ